MDSLRWDLLEQFLRIAQERGAKRSLIDRFQTQRSHNIDFAYADMEMVFLHEPPGTPQSLAPIIVPG